MAIADDTDGKMMIVAGAAGALPVVDRRAHVGDGRDPLFEQLLLREHEGAVRVGRERLRHRRGKQNSGSTAEHAARLAMTSAGPRCRTGGVRTVSPRWTPSTQT